ncbi:MAG: DUF4845 domain-containing protein [Burkholderiales bacterium]
MVFSPMRRQYGLTITTLVTCLIVVGIVAVFLIKVSPVWIEYYNIRQAIAGMEKSGDLAKSMPAVRESFDKRAEVGYITAIRGQDLDLSKTGNGFTVAFSYRKEIPIVANMSVVFDFEGSTGPAPSRKRAGVD